MSTRTWKASVGKLYDEDFALWSSRTADLLRGGRFSEVDVEHVAEEIEDMGKSEKRELLSRLTVLIVHLLKWERQPEKRTAGWQSTIATQRAELRRLFRQSPSLRADLAESVLEVYPYAVDGAGIETSLPISAFPAECPFTTEQLLDRSFLPGSPES